MRTLGKKRAAVRNAAAVLLAIVAAGLAAPAPAQQGQRPVVLDTAGRESGDVFRCRIPVEIQYDGSPPLARFRVIAKVYDGDRELASTGIAGGDRPLVVQRGSGGLDYEAVPLQFDLTRDLCRRIDGLRIVFARCAFGDREVEDCLDLVRFAAAPRDDPLFLALD